jgi:hypothetical protein
VATLQIREQVQNPRLDRNIQRRRRFVEDEQLGFGGEGAGDADPLTLSAGELVWIPGGERRRKSGVSCWVSISGRWTAVASRP